VRREEEREWENERERDRETEREEERRKRPGWRDFVIHATFRGIFKFENEMERKRMASTFTARDSSEKRFVAIDENGRIKRTMMSKWERKRERKRERGEKKDASHFAELLGEFFEVLFVFMNTQIAKEHSPLLPLLHFFLSLLQSLPLPLLLLFFGNDFLSQLRNALCKRRSMSNEIDQSAHTTTTQIWRRRDRDRDR
jgi:hypothetical protein